MKVQQYFATPRYKVAVISCVFTAVVAAASGWLTFYGASRSTADLLFGMSLALLSLALVVWRKGSRLVADRTEQLQRAIVQREIQRRLE
jgi:hypothetical protein